jgi:hypothetical protein
MALSVQKTTSTCDRPFHLGDRKKHQTTQQANESLKAYLVGGDRSLATETKEKKEYEVQHNRLNSHS